MVSLADAPSASAMSTQICVSAPNLWLCSHRVRAAGAECASRQSQACCVITSTGTVKIVEQCGKFQRTARPGFGWLVPCLQGVSLEDSGDFSKAGGYDNGHDCRWVLSCSDSSQAPQITFSQFDTEGGWDFVNIYDGPDETDVRVARLHGNTVPDYGNVNTAFSPKFDDAKWTQSTGTLVLRLAVGSECLLPSGKEEKHRKRPTKVKRQRPPRQSKCSVFCLDLILYI